MTTKTSHVAPTREVSADTSSPWNFLADIGRHQLAMATESSSALYRGSEALRKIQQEAAHQASVCHGEAAQKLLSPCQAVDLVAIQTELMCVSLQGTAKYWQQLVTTTLQTQVEMMSSVSRVLDKESRNGMKSVLETFQSVVPPLPTSFFVPTPNHVTEPH